MNKASHDDVMEALKKLKRSHLVVEDGWYSCPKSGECLNDNAGTECNCGDDGHNAKIDEIVAALSQPNPSCLWAQDDEDSDTWETACNKAFTLNEGSPNENDFRFCVFCGKPVEEAKHPGYGEEEIDATNPTGEPSQEGK